MFLADLCQLAVKVVLPGPHKTVFPVAVGAGGEGFTVIVIVAQLGLNCPPLLLLTKYVVVVFGLTVNVAPVPTCVPPHDPVYQNCVPIAPLAVNVTD